MTDDFVFDILKKEFDSAVEDVERIHGGLMSYTYRVSFRENSYILQVTDNNDPHELENCLKSFMFLQKHSNIPVPKVLTRELKEFNSKHYTIVEDIEGSTLDKSLSSEMVKEAGSMLAHIHDSHSFDKAGWIEWRDDEPVVLGFPGDSLQNRLEEYLEEKLEFFKSEDVDWLARVTERFLNEYLENAPDDFDPVFVHHDYNPGNILVEDGEIVGVLDFDYSHSSHAQRDLVKAMNKFWVKTSASKDDFLEGYREVRDLGAGFEQNRALYELETLIDELKARLEFVIDTKDELREYTGEVERLESILSG